MKSKILTLFAALILLLSSCKKDEDIKPLPDKRYPYTYCALNQSELERLNLGFRRINIHDGLFINKFGFLEGKLFLKENTIIDAELVVSQTELALKTYSNFMGIKNESTINVVEDISASDFGYLSPDGTTDLFTYFNIVLPTAIENLKFWAKFHEYEYVREPFTHDFYLQQESLSNSLLKSTYLVFSFSEEDKSVGIRGNWYPDAFIPSSQIYTLKDAIYIASDVFKDEVDKNIWYIDNQFSPMHTKLTLYPLVFEHKIEIREIWELTAYSYENFQYYNIYIDTQTGEILRKHSAIMEH